MYTMSCKLTTWYIEMFLDPTSMIIGLEIDSEEREREIEREVGEGGRRYR